MKLLIALATYNRPGITAVCLENLQLIRDPARVRLVVYDDASVAYSARYLSTLTDEVVRFERNGGIERSRARAFRDFIYRFTDYDLLYLTDNDTVHDPQFVDYLLHTFECQIRSGSVSPMGLFNSVFHRQSLLAKYEGFNISSTCPGISQCYTRDMAEKIVDYLNADPLMESRFGWDYRWPQILREPFLISTTSYVEHFARDAMEGGIHCKLSGTDLESFLRDFERDRAVNPSQYLIDCRDDVIDRVMSAARV